MAAGVLGELIVDQIPMDPRFVSILGVTFGNRRVVDYVGYTVNSNSKLKSHFWKCVCIDCGYFSMLSGHTIKRQTVAPCRCVNDKCRRSRLEAMVGQKFGRLTVFSITNDHKCECECLCGNIIERVPSHLNNKWCHSCGCYSWELLTANSDKLATHRMSNTSAFGIWLGMFKRCYQETNPSYSRYGGRGIYVVDEWHAFENFYADMGGAPEGHSIDRIDNDGPYSKENCRWATPKQQARNTRRTRWVELDGIQMSLPEACELRGMPLRTVYSRMRKGWPFDKAINTPVRTRRVHTM